MTTQAEAVKKRKIGIMSWLFLSMVAIGVSIFALKYNVALVLVFTLIFFALYFGKIAYDAYKTPILYIRQHMTMQENHKRDKAGLRRNHGISKYNLWK